MNTVDFNKYRPPILMVPMPDEAGTILQVTPPTFDLQEELRARARDLNALLEGGDENTREAIWDLAARLMSCNRNWRKITPEDLRKTYKLVEDDLIVFYEAYVQFLSGIENAKN